MERFREAFQYFVGAVGMFCPSTHCVLQACKQNKAKARKETEQDLIKEQTAHTPQQPQHGNPSQHPKHIVYAHVALNLDCDPKSAHDEVLTCFMHEPHRSKHVLEFSWLLIGLRQLLLLERSSWPNPEILSDLEIL